MNETLGYIESYFENGLTTEERTAFEQRIAADAAFASEVAFYLQTRQALRQQLIQQKQEGWKAASTAENATPVQAHVIPLYKPSPIRQWMVAAAVIVVVALGSYFIFVAGGAKDTTQLAQQYSDSAFGQLSHLMGASQDSLQQGITAYNAGKWQEAEKIFDGVYAAHPETVDALKYSGIAAIKEKENDKAVKQFQQLAANKDLFANPGLFYQAIALLLRNQTNDTKQAATLLQQVVNGRLPGNVKAAEILQQINK